MERIAVAVIDGIPQFLALPIGEAREHGNTQETISGSLVFRQAIDYLTGNM